MPRGCVWGAAKKRKGGLGWATWEGGPRKAFSWCFRHGLLDIGAAMDNIPAVMQLVLSGCKSPSTVLEHVGFMPALSQGMLDVKTWQGPSQRSFRSRVRLSNPCEIGTIDAEKNSTTETSRLCKRRSPQFVSSAQLRCSALSKSHSRQLIAIV